MKYIPLFANGKITERACAKLIGITPMSAWRLKERYKKHGNACFVHGNTGKSNRKKIYDYDKIAKDYTLFAGTPFAAFLDNCKQFLNYSKVPCYTTMYKILTNKGITSPKARPKKPKKKHLPRKERANEGDLLQAVRPLLLYKLIE